MRARTLGVAVSSLLWASTFLLAQAPAGSPTPSGPSQRTPARDTTSQPPSGTAVIKGRVVAADSGRPLRRGRISVSAAELGQEGRTASTDADGRYEIKDLPAGRYSVSVTRSGYLQLRYGQRRPLEQGKQLDVAGGQVLANIDFALPKMSVITGRATDEAGDPIEGVNVFAMRFDYWNGRRRLVTASPSVRTDDVGQYRLTGLMPGAYVVMATTRETWTTNENGKTEVFGYAPTYLPGLTNAAEAERVTVGVGQQVAVNDFALAPGRTAKVSGWAFDSRGRPIEGRVGITQETIGPGGGSFQSIGSGAVAADGSFTISNIPPGAYKIGAALRPNRDPGLPAEVTTQILAVDGHDVDGVRLTTSAAWSLAGRFRTESGDPPPIARTRVNIRTDPVSMDLAPTTSGIFPVGQVREDWTFSVTGNFGPSRVQVTLPAGWIVKSVLQADRDVTDTPLDMSSGEELSGLEVVLSNRVTRVAGQLVNEKGAPSTDGTVLVFATQSDKWFERSRFVRTARSDQQGRFEMVGLPPGQYFAIALDYIQDGIWNDPEYLAGIQQLAQKLTLENDTQSTTVSMKVINAPE